MATCDCGNITLGNSGRADCTNIANATNNLILVPTFDSTGAKNYIDTSVTLDLAYFTALINQSDKTKKIYPLPAMKNVTSERAEPNKQEFPDGSSIVLQQGVKSFNGEWVGKDASTAFMSKIENYGCSDVSAYIIDVDGSVIGNGEDTDKLYPIKLDGDTWFINLMDAVMGSSVQALKLTYQYDRGELDSNLRMIVASETTTDMRDLRGLQDVTAGAASGIATTGFVTVLTGSYGTAKTANSIKGLLAADFTVYNETQTASVTITSVTESPDGTYTFLFGAETSADVLTLALVKDGLEMTDLTVTIP